MTLNGGELRRQGLAAMAAKRWRDAESHLQRWLDTAPQDAEAQFLLGVARAEQQRFAAAVPALQQAARLDRRHADSWAQLARCLSALQRLAEAADAAEVALGCSPRSAQTLATIGVVFSRANRHAQAAQAFAAAVAGAPEQTEHWFNLAAALRFVGDFAAAEQALLRLLQLDADCWRAYPLLVQLRRQRSDGHHLPQLQAALDRADSVEARVQLHQALAKTHEDLGDDRAALAHWTQARSQWRAQLRYDFAQDAAMFAALHRRFAALPVGQGSGCASDAPIFVVGLPRSGTTLTDRILGMHSEVYSAGELQNFPWTLRQLAATRDADPCAGDAVIDLTELGQRYLRSTRPNTDARPRFVDKLPLNLLHLGWIAQALPQASIVCLRRHPLDTVLSNYRQQFALRHSPYNYALDLLDCARYYIEFDRLLVRWQCLFPGRIFELGYEALVGDPEPQIRALLQHCRLDWQPACLNFHDNPTPVATASAEQVRQPLYRSAVGRWRRHAEALQPAAALLREAGIVFDD